MTEKSAPFIKRNGRIGIAGWISLAVSLTVIVGGFFFPILGLFVPLLLIFAVITNFFRNRWFCGKACPRAYILGGFLPGISRYKNLPRFLYSDGLRSVLCGFLLICAVGQTSRLFHNLQALGWFFWFVCAGTFAFALILGLAYKPRAWCALCPVGTLQQTLRRK